MPGPSGSAAMSEQFNQAIGLALGGGLVALLGSEMGLLFDLLTFVVAAIVIVFAAPLRPVTGEHGKGLRGFFSDIRVAAGDLAGHPVLARLVLLSAVAGLGIGVDRLDQAVGSAKLETRAPRWWRAASLLQWLLVAAAAVGTLWIALAGVAGYLRIEDVVPLPELRGAPIATWLVLGGLVLGVVLSFVTRAFNAVGARRRRRAAARALRPGIEAVADDLVLAPVERELEAHETLRQSLTVALGERE